MQPRQQNMQLPAPYFPPSSRAPINHYPGQNTGWNYKPPNPVQYTSPFAGGVMPAGFPRNPGDIAPQDMQGFPTQAYF